MKHWNFFPSVIFCACFFFGTDQYYKNERFKVESSQPTINLNSPFSFPLNIPDSLKKKQNFNPNAANSAETDRPKGLFSPS